MRLSRPHRLAGLILAGLAALVPAAGCGPDGGGSDPGTTTAPPARMSPVPDDASYNAADVVFAQETLRHLTQAVEMAQLARSRAAGAEVKALAAKAETDRKDVVAVLNQWLVQSKQPVISASPTAGQAGGRSGLASADEMKELANLSGEPFDRLFLQMLIINNESAANMLTGQQWAGKNPSLMSVAHELGEAGKAELVKARQLLGR
jgi:uncharacterized protein (DUF305 family)